MNCYFTSLQHNITIIIMIIMITITIMIMNCVILLFILLLVFHTILADATMMYVCIHFSHVFVFRILQSSVQISHGPFHGLLDHGFFHAR